MHSDSAATLDKPTVRRSLERHLLQATGIEPEAAEPKDWLYATAAFARSLVLERWAIARRTRKSRGEGGLLLLDGVPDRPPADGHAAQPRHLRGIQRGPGEAASTSRRSRNRSRMPASATAAWAGWPPASSTAWRRSACRPTATASATSSACSPANPGRLAGRGAGRLAAQRRPVGVSAPGRDLSRQLRRRRAHDRRRGSPDRAEQVLAMAFDMPMPGYGTETVNTLRLWSARRRASSISPLQPGRLHRRGRRQEPWESLTRVLYPHDGTATGRELRLRAGVLLRQRVAAGHPAAATCARTGTLRRAAASRSRSTSTTPIRRSPCRADAAAGGRARHRVGRRLDITQRTISYTNHTLMPEALETWPLAFFERAAAPPGDHLRDQRRFLDEVAARHPGDDDLLRRVSLIDEAGERRVRMAYLAVVGSHKVNGVSQAAHRPDASRRCSPTSPAASRAASSTSPTASRRGAGWRRPTQPRLADRLAHRRRLAARPRPAASSWRRWRTMPISGRASRAAKARNKARLAVHIRARRRRRRPDLAVRRAGQAHPRIQAPAAEPAARRRALQRDPRATPARDWAPHGHLRRQGGARLRHGQADHQARSTTWRAMVNNDPRSAAG